MPEEFALSYQGSKQIEARIRHALFAFAIRHVQFWQSSVLICIVGVVAALFLGGAHPYVYVPLFAFTVAFAAILPIAGLRELSKVSKSYANSRVTYATSFGSETFLWRTATGTYEIAWDALVRAFTRDRATIVGLRDSRAICVLLSELLTPPAETHLAMIANER